MKINYKIYKLIDPIDNLPRYIGLTFNTLRQRLKSHRNEKGKSHKIYWIKSLLEKNLSPRIEIVESGIETYEIACEREVYWISKFKEDGFDLTNSTNGGDKNKKMSDETRLKMSISQKERNKTHKRVWSIESKIKISESTKLRMSDVKEIEKLQISNKKYEDSKTKYQKINDILIQKNRKSISQFDMDMNLISEFMSIRDAERKSKVSRPNISKCCKLKVLSAGGFIWRYSGDTSRRPDKRHSKKCKSVMQFDLNMNIISEFISVKDASDKTKVGKTGIYGCCNNKFKNSGGFIWKYKDNI